jgi:hypothetical protein
MHLLDRRDDRARRLRELDLGRMEEGVLGLRLEAFLLALEVADGNAVEGPAVGVRDIVQLSTGLGEGHVDSRFAAPGAGE